MKRRKIANYILALCTVLAVGACSDSDDYDVIITPKTPAQEVFSTAATAKNNLNIYQVNPKLYGKSGAYGKIQARLDDIKALGTDVLYLMPVYTEGKDKSVGSPYCIKDFKGVNPDYGTLAELKGLVDAAHGKGMKVLFDWVANHTSWDNAWTSEHSDWYEKDAKGNIVSPSRDGAWADVAQLNYENKDLWNGMIDAMKYWIDECGIDGFRCDYAHGVKDDFWKEAISQLKAKKSDFIMLAESDYTRMFDDGFDIIFDRAMKSHVQGLVNGGSASDFFSWYKEDLASAPGSKTKLFFITNHDDCNTASPIAEFKNKDGALAAFFLMASLNGSPMIYGSQENGYEKTINFFNTMDFNFTANAAYTTKYNKVMAALSGLDRGAPMKAYTSAGVIFLCYEATGSAKAYTIAVNPTSQVAKAVLPVEVVGKDVTEKTTGTGMVFKLQEEVSFTGYSYRVWEHQ